MMDSSKSLARMKRQYTEPYLDLNQYPHVSNSLEIENLENNKSWIGKSFLENKNNESFIHLNNVSKFKSPVGIKINLTDKYRTIHSYFNKANIMTNNISSIKCTNNQDVVDISQYVPENSSYLDIIRPNIVYPLKTKSFLPPISKTFDNFKIFSSSSKHTQLNIENNNEEITYSSIANDNNISSSNDTNDKTDLVDNPITSSELDFKTSIHNIDALKFLSVGSTDLEEYTQLNQYKLKDEIGKGSYGIVKLAFNKLDNKNYAMKMISKQKLLKRTSLLLRPPSRRRSALGPSITTDNNNNKQAFERIYKEIAILKKLDHPNVVKLIEVLDDLNSDYFCLVFEYVEKGFLIEIPTDEPLSEKVAWRYFRDLVKGVEYLHCNKVIHRDIKPSNLLLDEKNHVKIVDFGISNEFDGDDAVISNSLGTPAFMPPEALNENRSFWMGKPLDIWAMGITLFCFVHGHCPFNEECSIELRNKIQYSDVVFPKNLEIKNSLKDLIVKLLTKNPDKRIQMADIKNHSWVTDNNLYPLITDLKPPITVTDDEVKNSITSLYRLETLIFIKAMIKKRSFSHPFRRSFSASNNSIKDLKTD